MRQMTEAARAGIEAARAQKAEVRAHRLIVGAWQIYRADPQNVVLQKGDGDPLYYPDVPSAILSLFRRTTDPTAKQDLAGHVKVIERAERAILEAVGKAGGLEGLFGA